MKLRPFIILLLFVVSLGVLAWMYYTASHDHTRRRESPWHEVLMDLNEFGRIKHVKSTQYAQFADIADQESEPDAARLFRAMSLSEQIHEQNCIEAINRLGGKYMTPDKVVVFKGNTADNLSRSLSFERQLHEDRRKSGINRAMEANNRYAARILIWAEGGDLQHICLMQHCSEKAPTPAGYAVCPTCGSIYPIGLTAHYCPFCLTGSNEFVRFE